MQTYPSIDFIFELFKGIAPTFVALLAIFINNGLAKSREEKNRKIVAQREFNQLKIDILNCMPYKYIELSQLFWISGTKEILYLSEEDQDKREFARNEFEKSICEFQFKVQEIFDYYKSVFEKFFENINCSASIDDAHELFDRLITICESYNETYKICDVDSRNKILDEAAKEIKDVTIDAKAWTGVIMDNIGKEIKKMYEIV